MITSSSQLKPPKLMGLCLFRHLVTPKHDGSLETTVYRKPTHTNQYLQWGSHHAVTNIYSIISTLLHRAKTSVPTNNYWKKNKQIYRRP